MNKLFLIMGLVFVLFWGIDNIPQNQHFAFGILIGEAFMTIMFYNELFPNIYKKNKIEEQKKLEHIDEKI